MRTLVVLSILLMAIYTYAQLPPFNAADQPAAPDYSQEKNWSALPFRSDAADDVPKSEKWVSDSLKAVDVFFIYPTIYMAGATWNADLDNKSLNRKIDNKPVRYQAGVFNASCRVYAPRYRQSIIRAFYDQAEGAKSLAFAYADVKKAFQYYLEHYNNGRPFIIASHSQGSYHARRLLQEMIDTTVLRQKLVAAYVVGCGINREIYHNLKPCESANETGCYVTWASYKKGSDDPDEFLVGNVCVNPISWKTDTVAVDASQSMGSMLLNFDKKWEHAAGAQIHNHYLWVSNRLPIVRNFSNLHIADYNLFWYDIRKNVKDRVDAYLKK